MGSSLLEVKCNAPMSFHFYPGIRSTGRARLGTRLEQCWLERPGDSQAASVITTGSGLVVANGWPAEKWGRDPRAAPPVPEKCSEAL